MEGKTIVKTVELGQDYILAKFDDGEIAFLQVITPDGLEEELNAILEDEKPSSKKAEKKPKESEPEDEPEEDDEPDEDNEDSYSWGDLMKMGFKELKKFVKENDLDVKLSDYDEDEEEELREDIAEEIGIEPEKKSKPKKEEPEEDDDEEPEDDDEEPEEDADDDEDDDYTWDDLKKMDFDELTELCKEGDLDTDPVDYEEDEEDDLRRAIAKEIGITPPKKSGKKK